MKIAHVLHPYQPGLGYQENYLPAKQRELGHQVRIFTSDYIPNVPNPDFDIGTGVYLYKGVSTHRLPSILKLDSIGETYLRRLARELTSFSPDVIHAHGLITFRTIQCVLYNIKRKTPMLVDVHIDNDNLHIDNPMKWLLFNLYKRLLFPGIRRRVSCFLPVNPYAESFLRNEFDISKSEMEFLPLGVDTEVFSPSVGTADLRSSNDLDESDTVFICSGNLNETKDVEILLRAYASCVDHFRKSHLLLVGDGPSKYLHRVEESINTLGIRSHVTFLGRVPHDELPKYYNAVDFGVWPGKLGITAIEALGCGVPPILCDSQATSFLVSNDNGLVFNRGSISGLQGCLRVYLADESLRQEHAKRTKELADEELSWSNIAQVSIQIYQEYVGE